jgi:hypothetical protein
VRGKPYVKSSLLKKANPSDWLFSLKIIELLESFLSPIANYYKNKGEGIVPAFLFLTFKGSLTLWIIIILFKNLKKS